MPRKIQVKALKDLGGFNRQKIGGFGAAPVSDASGDCSGCKPICVKIPPRDEMDVAKVAKVAGKAKAK